MKKNWIDKEIEERLEELSCMRDDGLIEPLKDEYAVLIEYNYTPEEALDKIEEHYKKMISGK